MNALTSNTATEQAAMPLMTSDEVARRLNVCRKTVNRMTRRGEIPVVEVGPRKLRYDRSQLEAWIRAGGGYHRIRRTHGGAA